MKKATSLIITSIASPNEVLKSCAEGSRENGVRFIVIGDVKSPADFKLDSCEYYSVEAQEKTDFRLAKLLPYKHYARKNLGYLLAKDSEVIIETDDDNFPRQDFWSERIRMTGALKLENQGWVNVYRAFSDSYIWPRGFPIEFLQDDMNSGSDLIIKFRTKGPELMDCPIQQGLADDNPDVDAIYRMTMKLPVVFGKVEPIALAKGSWCPFNSQNTTWFKEAFPLLYLPSYCSFRMTDIWRSFIAQRIAWTCNWSVLFHSSTVWQERNEHNLLKDFADEVPGYLNNVNICKALEEADLKSGVLHIAENLMRCYKIMVSMNLVDEKELKLVDAWLQDIS
ncbi:MAG: DUF288 domain-containing protein [Bacteroidetes bacterium]|nr:MAG: DUF288 domain-containing protein [Bacteroidota bacterium]REK05767.1 MAG: DUF288 domain-containing protein [Bacteroidota bacterium]REK31927.1 MAG: DUF288 domain-containing protein [Bacteroidota bacterium]REK49992.1 MAG: DUF288 domain-containing protein [Bacteroidota bacterium]